MTMPSDPGLAHLTRRVSFHFFREHGLGTLEARRRARSVERGCQAILGRRAIRSATHPPSLILTLTSSLSTLEVIGRLGARGAVRKLVRLKRPVQS